MTRIVLAFGLWLLASVASAQLVRVTNEHATSTRKCDANGVCYQSRLTDHGSGVVIGKDAGHSLVLTVFHVVREPSRALMVQGSPARVVATDPANDLAILDVSFEFTNCFNVGIARAGDDVTLAGFGGGQYADRPARLVQPDRVNVVARDGDSGGAVVCGGMLVGIISAVGPDYTHVVPAPTLKQFIQRHVPHCHCHRKPAPQAPLLPQPDPRFQQQQPSAQPPTNTLAIGVGVGTLDDMRLLSSLMRRVAELEQRLQNMPTSAQGPPGRDGTNGRDASPQPITVRLDSVGPDGTVTKGKPETFAPGETVVIRYRELKGQ